MNETAETSDHRDYSGYADWKDWSKKFSYSQQEAAYFRAEFQRFVRAESKVLDVGFGSGALLKWMGDQGAACLGVEIQDNLREAARQAGIEVYADISHVSGSHLATFDFVVALDVLEHMDHAAIRSFLEVAGRLLKPDGRIVIRVPNGASPFGRCYQHGDATHISVITPSKIGQLCAGTSLCVAESRDPRRVLSGNRMGQRLRFAILLALREATSRFLRAIYDLPVAALDPNIIIELKHRI